MSRSSLTAEQLGDATQYLHRRHDARSDELRGRDHRRRAAGHASTSRSSPTEPGFAGDTAQGARKPATTQTGLVVQVPLFVQEGDTIRVDTRTGEYQTRV